MTAGDVEVLVVGVGLAGASAARVLADAGRRVLAIDKGRGPGGRLSTRRSDAGTFDHGAVALQAAGEAFRRWLEAEALAGRAARWRDGWVGLPGMNALVAGLLDGIDVRWATNVASLERAADAWQALDAEGRMIAGAPQCVVAIPAPQARDVLRAGNARDPARSANPAQATPIEALSVALAHIRYEPCWSVLLDVDPSARREASPPANALASPADLDAIVHEAEKPGRAAGGRVVVQASAAWSVENLERSADDVGIAVRRAFVEATGLADDDVRSAVAHRWRYARPLDVIDERIARSVDGLALAGDFVGVGSCGECADAERAWLSGLAAAEMLLGSQAQPKS